jgi:hypothetical protein
VEIRRASVADFQRVVLGRQTSPYRRSSPALLKSCFNPRLAQNPLSLFPPLHQTYGIDPEPDREYIRETLYENSSEPERSAPSRGFISCSKSPISQNLITENQNETRTSPIILSPRRTISEAMVSEWITYRTRFLICAKQLDEPLTFVDCIGREHSGQKGDYLVLSSDGSKRIAPRAIFEDIYVPMNQPAEVRRVSAPTVNLFPTELLQRSDNSLQSEPPQADLTSPEPLSVEIPGRRTPAGHPGDRTLVESSLKGACQ